MLARHGRRLLNLLDDSAVVPGDVRAGFEDGMQARQILNDAEDELRQWQANLVPVTSGASLQKNLMPADESTAGTSFDQQSQAPTTTAMTDAVGDSEYGETVGSGEQYGIAGQDEVHPAHRKGEMDSAPNDGLAPGSGPTAGQSYAASEVESHSALV